MVLGVCWLPSASAQAPLIHAYEQGGDNHLFQKPSHSLQKACAPPPPDPPGPPPPE